MGYIVFLLKWVMNMNVQDQYSGTVDFIAEIEIVF
jgi:hypothetical protein